MEKRIEKIGENLVTDGLLKEFKRHEANSQEDWDGADFTAIAIIDGQEFVKSFGVTISSGSKALEDKFRYNASVPEQWWIPWNTKNETIRKKILQLFEKIDYPSI